MAVKKYRPTSPVRRHMTTASFDEVTTGKPEKSLVRRIKKHCGRNATGHITQRHQGGGNKHMYRIMDFSQTDKLNIEGTVKAIEYDPARSAYIMLVIYKDGEKRYHLAPEGVKVGSKISAKAKAKVKLGSRMMIKNIPIGYQVHNIEMEPGQGGKLVRAAGGYATIASLEGERAQIQMPSGEVRLIPKECYASIGPVGNLEHANIVIGKAGRRRWMGWRPSVRGKAMNACDHPHGGGKGHCPIGLKHPKTPWGMPALGFKTRKRHTLDKYIIKDRRHG